MAAYYLAYLGAAHHPWRLVYAESSIQAFAAVRTVVGAEEEVWLVPETSAPQEHLRTLIVGPLMAPLTMQREVPR